MKYLYISSTFRWEDNENNSIYPCTNNPPVECSEGAATEKKKKKINI